MFFSIAKLVASCIKLRISKNSSKCFFEVLYEGILPDNNNKIIWNENLRASEL